MSASVAREIYGNIVDNYLHREDSFFDDLIAVMDNDTSTFDALFDKTRDDPDFMVLVKSYFQVPGNDVPHLMYDKLEKAIDTEDVEFLELLKSKGLTSICNIYCNRFFSASNYMVEWYVSLGYEIELEYLFGIFRDFDFYCKLASKYPNVERSFHSYEPVLRKMIRLNHYKEDITHCLTLLRYLHQNLGYQPDPDFIFAEMVPFTLSASFSNEQGVLTILKCIYELSGKTPTRFERVDYIQRWIDSLE